MCSAMSIHDNFDKANESLQTYYITDLVLIRAIGSRNPVCFQSKAF